MTARILIVDDVPANTRLLEAKLSAEYYQVATAKDGFEALRMALEWQPDLILLDVMMPGMDGFECCRRLKADATTLHIPVVMVTALGEPGERLHGLESGADDFLTKPVEYETLMARVRSLVRLKRLLDEWRARSETARAMGLTSESVAPPSIAGARALVVDDGGSRCTDHPGGTDAGWHHRWPCPHGCGGDGAFGGHLFRSDRAQPVADRGRSAEARLIPSRR